MVIDLGEKTAQQLIAAASSEGMTVEEFVRVLLSSSHRAPQRAPKDQEPQTLIGAMTQHSDLFDEVLQDAYESRERDPLRIDSDE